MSLDSEAARLNLPVEKSTSPSRRMSPTPDTVVLAKPEISDGNAIAASRRGTFGVRVIDLTLGSDGIFGVIEMAPDAQFN